MATSAEIATKIVDLLLTQQRAIDLLSKLMHGTSLQTKHNRAYYFRLKSRAKQNGVTIMDQRQIDKKGKNG